MELIGVIYRLWFSDSIIGRASVPFEEIISGVSRKNPSKYIPAIHNADFKRILLMGLLKFCINAINQVRGYLILSKSLDNRETLASRTFMLLRHSVLTQASRPYEFFRPHTCRRSANLNAVPVQPDTLSRKGLNRLLRRMTGEAPPAVTASCMEDEKA